MKTKILNIKSLLFTLAVLFSVLDAAAYCRVDTSYNYTYPGNAATRNIKGRAIYSYNIDSTVATELSQNYSAGFVNDSRTTYTYNTSKKVLTLLVEKFDVPSNTWQNDVQILNVYSSGIYLNSKTYRTWDGSSWVFVNKNLYTRDASNNNIEEEYQEWQTSTSTWRYVTKVLKTYTSNLLSSEIMQFYNTATIVWDDYSKMEYARNGFGQVSKKITYNAPPASSTWDTTTRNLYTYSGISLSYETEERKTTSTGPWYFFSKAFQKSSPVSFKLLERNYLEYDRINNVWDSVQRNTYEYNSSYDLIAEDEFYGYNGTTERYNNRSRVENSCRGFNVGIQNISEESSFSIYPNPVSAQNLTINALENTSFTMSDLSGKTLLSGDIRPGENTIQLQDYSTGIYLIKVGNTSK